jgi:hypothetical protein
LRDAVLKTVSPETFGNLVVDAVDRTKAVPCLGIDAGGCQEVVE